MCPDAATQFLQGLSWGVGGGFVLALVMIYVIFKSPTPRQ